MKRFRFRLEAVLQQRRLVYDQKATELATTVNALNAERTKLDAIQSQQAETLLAFEDRRRRGLEVRDAALYLPFLERLTAQATEQAERVEQAKTRVSAAQAALEAARTQYEIVEQLKKKAQEAYLTEVRREEQRFLDDISSTRYKSPSSTN